MEDGWKINRIYIDLILTLSEGLDLNVLLKLLKKEVLWPLEPRIKGWKVQLAQVFLTLSTILNERLEPMCE